MGWELKREVGCRRTPEERWFMGGFLFGYFNIELKDICGCP
jgi:hypothetical protein